MSDFLPHMKNPKLALCSRIRKLSSKNMGIFRCNLLSIKAVIPQIFYWRVKSTATTELHMAVVRSQLLRPHSRTDIVICTKCHPSGDRCFYCNASCISLAIGIGSPVHVEQFSQVETQGRHVKIYYCGNLYI